jgi:hypothetical protein
VPPEENQTKGDSIKKRDLFYHRGHREHRGGERIQIQKMSVHELHE